MVKDLLIFIPLVSGKPKLCSQIKASMPNAISHLAGSGPFFPTDCSVFTCFLIRADSAIQLQFLQALSYVLSDASLYMGICEADPGMGYRVCFREPASRQHEAPPTVSQKTGGRAAKKNGREGGGRRQSQFQPIHPMGSGFHCGPVLP